MAEIVISVPKGIKKPISISVNGVPGSQCQLLTKPLEDAMGGAKVSEELSDEFNQVPTAEHNYLRESQG